MSLPFPPPSFPYPNIIPVPLLCRTCAVLAEEALARAAVSLERVDTRAIVLTWIFRKALVSNRIWKKLASELWLPPHPENWFSYDLDP